MQVSRVLWSHQWDGTGAPNDEAVCCAELAVQELERHYTLVRKVEEVPQAHLYLGQDEDTLYDDPGTILEGWLDNEATFPLEIEVYSAKGVWSYLPDYERFVDWLTGDFGIDEDFIASDEYGIASERTTAALNDPEVKAAFEAAFALFASKVDWRVSDKRIRKMVVKANPDDPTNPLVDDEPFWVRRSELS